VVVVLAVMLVSMVRNVLIDGAGNYVLGGLLAAGFFAIYWGVDLLGVMMAELGYQAAGIALYFSHQESGTIHANGIVIAAAYGAIALAGAAAVVWAREVEVAPEEKVVEIAAEREILQSEFAMAREAQERLLPAIPECVEGFSLAASCHPARDVGGDLYDFFRYPDGTYGMCVADVSGKGVPAALYMTMTKGILAAASRDAADLPGLAAILNAQLYAAGRKKTFVTMALGRLDVISRQLEYLRAGHNSILWRRSVDGVCQYRKPRGVGLGLAASRTFDRSIEMETLALETGDLVVFYSDGITEAMNASRELFGEDRLEAVVDRYARLEATGIESAILREVRGFIGDEPPHDDMTLLVIRA
jgi:serine phosphatase RsbU (regulator of sigma subunit)